MEQTTTGLRTATKDQTHSTAHHRTSRVLLHNMYFLFQGKSYEQVETVAMESPVSIMISDIYMQHFEEVALRTAENPPRLWKRLVDVTFVIQCTENKEDFLHHTNSINQAVKFIVEDTQPDGSIPSLDTLAAPEQNRTLSTKFIRKPTNMDCCLHWDSHHHPAAKYTLNTLVNSAKTVCSIPELLRTDQNHLREVPIKCKHLAWTLDRMEHKTSNKASLKTKTTQNHQTDPWGIL